MKITPAMKIILAVAAACMAITLITTNNVATLMVLANITNSGAPVVSQGTVNQNNNTVNGTQNNGSTATTPDANANGSTATTPNANQGSANNATPNANQGGNNAAKPDNNAATGDTKAIIDQYVKALNKAKSSAKSVTLVSDGAALYNNVFEAGKLTSLGQKLVDKFMKIEDKNEAIDKNKIPPEGINASFTAADVVSAKSEKSGDKTVITILMKDELNPKAGKGVGSAVNVIEQHQITEPVEGIVEVSNINLAYEKVTMIATLDASGNLVELNIDAPCILSLDAKAPIVGEIKGAKVGIEIKSLYRITY